MGRFALLLTGRATGAPLAVAETVSTSSWNQRLYLDQGFLSLLARLIVTYSGLTGRLVP